MPVVCHLAFSAQRRKLGPWVILELTSSTETHSFLKYFLEWLLNLSRNVPVTSRKRSVSSFANPVFVFVCLDLPNPDLELPQKIVSDSFCLWLQTLRMPRVQGSDKQFRIHPPPLYDHGEKREKGSITRWSSRDYTQGSECSWHHVVGMWQVCGRRIPDVYQVYGKCIPGVWQVCTRCISGIYQVCSRCVAGVYQVCTRCISGVYQVCGRYVAGVYQVYIKYIPGV